MERNDVCYDCINRFSCIYESSVNRTSCNLYKSDSEVIQYLIDLLSKYLENKKT